ncbi:hypothetical protein C8R44DRAFT_741865 [Mycena epipterygia]|nr:hypothetical protein C8R44DRAFT_741865 [Mycena epipterygia]
MFWLNSRGLADASGASILQPRRVHGAPLQVRAINMARSADGHTCFVKYEVESSFDELNTRGGGGAAAKATLMLCHHPSSASAAPGRFSSFLDVLRAGRFPRAVLHAMNSRFFATAAALPSIKRVGIQVKFNAPRFLLDFGHSRNREYTSCIRVLLAAAAPSAQFTPNQPQSSLDFGSPRERGYASNSQSALGSIAAALQDSSSTLRYQFNITDATPSYFCVSLSHILDVVLNSYWIYTEFNVARFKVRQIGDLGRLRSAQFQSQVFERCFDLMPQSRAQKIAFELPTILNVCLPSPDFGRNFVAYDHTIIGSNRMLAIIFKLPRYPREEDVLTHPAASRVECHEDAEFKHVGPRSTIESFSRQLRRRSGLSQPQT